MNGYLEIFALTQLVFVISQKIFNGNFVNAAWFIYRKLYLQLIEFCIKVINPYICNIET